MEITVNTFKEYGLTMAAAFGALWVAAALVAEGTTFHIAPAIVAGVAPLTAGGSRVRAALGGLGVAFAVGLGLLLVGRLDGPSLLPWGDAALESALGAVGGAAVGLVVAGAAADRAAADA